MAEICKMTSYNAEGWLTNTESVQFFVTEEGGMIAPVNFVMENGKSVAPYHLTPWQDETNSNIPSGCLKNLRGDIFCLPFGGNAQPVDGEKHPAHGELTGEKWTCHGIKSKRGTITAEFSIDLKVRKANVKKTVTVVDGESVLYLSHLVTGMKGSMPGGHHPVLRMPADGTKMFLSLGNFDFAMTNPGVFSAPEKKSYQYLDYGAEFRKIEEIPTLFKHDPVHDYSVYPSPYGYCDLFTVYKKPAKTPAWAVAVYPEEGFLWFALKNSAQLPATNIWVSNSGRFFFPWSGRTYCIGIEDTCSYFANGLKDSVTPNLVNEKGISTAIEFNTKPVDIRHIQGVVPVPPEFGKVAGVSFRNKTAVFTDVNGKSVSAKVNYNFIFGK